VYFRIFTYNDILDLEVNYAIFHNEKGRFRYRFMGLIYFIFIMIEMDNYLGSRNRCNNYYLSMMVQSLPD
jgi:hypothetical protein